MRLRTVGWTVGAVLVLAVLTGVLGLVGVVVGSGSLSVATSVAARSVLTLVALATGVLLVARRGPYAWLPPVLALAAAAFVLTPLTWTAGAPAGGTLFGVAVTGSAWLGVLLDLVVWLLVAAGAGLAGLRTREA